MEREGSLPHSQVPATCPYPEPARSSPYPHIPLPKIHLNIILPSTPGSPKWSLFLGFLHQNPVYTSPPTHTRYMPRPSHSSRFYHPHNIGWGVQITNSLLCGFSPRTCYLIPLRPKYSPQLPILIHPQPMFLPHRQRPGLRNTCKKHDSVRYAKEMVYLNTSIMAPPWV